MAEARTCPFDHRAINDSREAWPVYDELRDDGVVYSPEHGGFYVITRHEDVLAALRDPDTFISGRGTRVPTIGEGRLIVIDNDPPIHTSYREVLTERLSPDAVRGMTDELRKLIARLVDDYYAAGGGDWVTQVGLPLPLHVLTQVVGFDWDTVTQFKDLADEAWDKAGEEDILEARAALMELVRHEVRRHRDTRPDDFITSLLDREIDGRPMTDDERERLLLGLAVAGHETTMNASGWILNYLATDPAKQDALRERPDRIPAFVEEALRHASPIQSIGRTTSRDVKIGGITIPAGARVLLVYAAANHDEDKFDHAAEFDIERSPAGHLAFGFGRHQCPGALLARTELRLLLEKLITLPRIELADDPVYAPLGGGTMSGLHALPLRFAEGVVAEVVTEAAVVEQVDIVRVSSPTETLELDLGKCNGYGNCVFAAPDMFELDLASNLPILLQDEWSDSERATMAAAVADCPAAALRLVPRGEGTGQSSSTVDDRTVVVVGASVAGTRCAMTLRDNGFSGSIVLIDPEEGDPYDKPQLSKHFELDRELELLVTSAVLRDRDIDFRSGVVAVGVDVDQRLLHTSEGPVAFDELVIATGCRARRLPYDLPQRASYVRTRSDGAELTEAVERGGRLLVLGGGFLGLEAAAAAASRGMEVTVVDVAPRILTRGIPESAARLIAEKHAAEGVRFSLGVEDPVLAGDEDTVWIGDVEADYAVVSIGALPNAEWLADSGLSLNDGVVCDENLAAAPGVWAAGDVARWTNVRSGRPERHEHWTTAVRHGQRVGQAIADREAHPVGETSYVWSDQFDWKIQSVGQVGVEEFVYSMDNDEYVVVCVNESGAVCGVTTINSQARCLRARQLLQETEPAFATVVDELGLDAFVRTS